MCEAAFALGVPVTNIRSSCWWHEQPEIFGCCSRASSAHGLTRLQVSPLGDAPAEHQAMLLLSCIVPVSRILHFFPKIVFEVWLSHSVTYGCIVHVGETNVDETPRVDHSEPPSLLIHCLGGRAQLEAQSPQLPKARPVPTGTCPRTHLHEVGTQSTGRGGEGCWKTLMAPKLKMGRDFFFKQKKKGGESQSRNSVTLQSQGEGIKPVTQVCTLLRLNSTHWTSLMSNYQ